MKKSTSKSASPKKHPLHGLNKRQWSMLALGAGIVLSAAVSVSKIENARTEYVCTKISSGTASCEGGEWSPWTIVATYNDELGREVTDQRRVYNGSRVLRHVTQYISRSTLCEDGFVSTVRRESGNKAGFVLGTVRTEQATCSIEEVQTMIDNEPLTGVRRTNLGDGVMKSAVTPFSSLEKLTAFRESAIASNIEAKPTVVSAGDQATLTWASTETTSCSVRGTNGDEWGGTYGELPSSALEVDTTFKLTCTAFNGTTTTDTVTVVVE